MYPITQGKKIETTDFYNHFIIECYPMKINPSSYTQIKDGPGNSDYFNFNLPVQINSANNEIWQFDIYIYGLATQDCVSSLYNESNPACITITLNRSDHTNDINLTHQNTAVNAHSNTGGSAYNYNGPVRMRHHRTIINFKTQRLMAEVMSGKIHGETVRSGTGGLSTESDTGIFTKITVTTPNGSNYPLVTRIAGLYIEATKLDSTTPTNTLKAIGV